MQRAQNKTFSPPSVTSPSFPFCPVNQGLTKGLEQTHSKRCWSIPAADYFLFASSISFSAQFLQIRFLKYCLSENVFILCLFCTISYIFCYEKWYPDA